MSEHQHQHQHAEADPHVDVDAEQMFTRTFWDQRYAGSERVWSGKPNSRLVEHVSGLPVGTALDVGCGEGADAVWLATQGWEVVGVDVSQVALDRAQAHAEEAGVGERTSFRQVDLLAGDPLPSADLVSAHFLHVPTARLEEVYAAIADAVRPGGTLLVAAHHPADADLRNPELAAVLFTPEQVVAVLEPAQWEVLVADTPTRVVRHGGGDPVTVTDTVVRAVRRSAAS